MRIERVSGDSAADVVDRVTELFVAYRAFYGRVGDEHEARAFVATRLARGDSLVWAALDEGRAVAFTQVYPGHSSVRLRTTWQLNDLFVAPDARGAGHGAALVRHVLVQARDAGAHEVCLETQQSNATARALYERLGFRLVVSADPGGEFVAYARAPAHDD